jgi:hypothetical protein
LFLRETSAMYVGKRQHAPNVRRYYVSDPTWLGTSKIGI